MKHYTDTKFYEWMVYQGEVEPLNNPRIRKSVSEVKRGYRRRERAALKRQTEKLVSEELCGYTESERGYWWREFERCKLDMDDLVTAEDYLRESGQWNEEHTRIFAAAYREVRKRTDTALDVLWAA